jgi:hypothetical protein
VDLLIADSSRCWISSRDGFNCGIVAPGMRLTCGAGRFAARRSDVGSADRLIGSVAPPESSLAAGTVVALIPMPEIASELRRHVTLFINTFLDTAGAWMVDHGLYLSR